MVDEALQAVAGGEVVQQILDRNARARKNRGATPVRPGRIARQIQAWAFLLLALESHATPCGVRRESAGITRREVGDARNSFLETT